MTVLVTADWHLSDNPRDDYRHKAMRTIRDIVRKHEVSRVLMLGDITEAKDRHGAWLVNQVVDHFGKLVALCPVTVMRGNHDYVTEDSPFYAFLSRIDGVTWVNNPTVLGKWLFLPHTRDYKKDWEGIELTGYKQIFAHNTFDGAVVESGRKMTGIPTEIFPGIRNHVISGDIHVPQRVGPVLYVGAPYTIDFGDAYEPRVLLLKNGEAPISIPVPGVQKRLLEIGSDLPQTVTANAGDIVQVRVHLKQREYAHWAEIREKVEVWADKLGLTLYSVRPIMEASLHTIVRESKAPISDEQILQAYSKARGIDERTLKVGMDLL